MSLMNLVLQIRLMYNRRSTFLNIYKLKKVSLIEILLIIKDKDKANRIKSLKFKNKDTGAYNNKNNLKTLMYKHSKKFTTLRFNVIFWINI